MAPVNNFRNGLSRGGHLSHGAPITLSGKVYRSVTYGVHDDGYIDYDEVEKPIPPHKSQVIVAGASAYPKTNRLETF